ncbi:MAG: phosphoglycerate mutase family protein [Oscillospiraceae bacterium]|nr:phosphoglycerate mutase family protein [Oscillospiraceae bacterium]
MKNIITIQHTQSEQHVNGMIGSWTDWELTGAGREQAENIGKKLSAEIKGQSWKIYSSDLSRARQTAEPLARYMKTPVEYREKLREHNMGEAVGKSKQWVKENALPVNSFDGRLFPSAESWRKFWERVSDLCAEIVADEAENIILVSHGGTLAVLQGVWLGSDVRDCKFGPPGGVSFMGITENGEHVIRRLNDISYKEK